MLLKIGAVIPALGRVDRPRLARSVVCGLELLTLYLDVVVYLRRTLSIRLMPTWLGIFSGPSMMLIGALLLRKGTLLIGRTCETMFPPLRCLVSPLFLATPCPRVTQMCMS